jgi:hypothetical protein
MLFLLLLFPSFRRYSPRPTIASSFEVSEQNVLFIWWVFAHAQSPTWRTRISLLAWIIAFDPVRPYQKLLYRQLSYRDHLIAQAHYVNVADINTRI